jgi:hypothetical protein
MAHIDDAETTPTTCELELSVARYHDAPNTLRIIQDLILADKPAEVTPVALSVVVALLSLKVYECSYSQLDLASMLGCGIATVRQALLILGRLGWVSQSQRPGCIKSLTVNIKNLPILTL